MKKLICNVILVITAILISGCIKNDIPYPHLETGFLTISAKNQAKNALIDKENKTVTLYLPETENITEVTIDSYTITENAELMSPNMSEPLNLKKPLKAMFHLYYDYEWTIKAEQSVERYFTVENQVGASVIDVPGKRVVATIPETVDLERVKITSIKLGPAEVSEMSPELNGEYADFTRPMSVLVKYFGITEKWTIYVQQTAVSVSLGDVDAWSKVIWVSVSAQDGRNNGVQYKRSDSEDWRTVPESWVTASGGSLKACIRNLDATTSYDVRAFCDDEYTPVQTVVTESILELPNAGLDDWHKNGKIWEPWAQGGTSFWDTGNGGATTLGESNSVPTTVTWDGQSGYAAMLETKFVGIGSIGKLAAGNLFSGEFLRVDGTNGILNFGREFIGRPTKLHGYCKYKTSPIAYTNSDLAYMKGQPDTAVVYMALTDWDMPYEIRTNPKNQHLFDRNSSAVIAYGEVQYGESFDDFREFTVTLEYRATNRKPKYILIVCTASKYGDFFTGGSNSIFVVDNLWLDWDY